MINLLSAGFYRIRKNPTFYIFSVIIITFEVYLIFNTYGHSKGGWMFGDLISLSSIVFYILLLGLFGAIFVSFFLGEDYYNGSIRNKMVVGYNRKKIYLANFILMNAVTIFYLLVHLVILFGLGLPLFGTPAMTTGEILFTIFLFVLIDVAYTSVLVCIGILSSSMTRSITISMLLSISLLVGALLVSNALEEPETIGGYIMENGENKMVTESNPKYPSQGKRAVLEFSNKVNPAGACLSTATNIERLNPKKNGELVFYSVGVIIVFTGLGLLSFDKKELN